MDIMNWIKQRNLRADGMEPTFQVLDAWETVIKDMKEILAEEYDCLSFSDEGRAFFSACCQLNFTYCDDHECVEPCPRGINHAAYAHIETVKHVFETYIKVVSSVRYKHCRDSEGKLQLSPALKRLNRYVLPFLRGAKVS